MPRQRYKVTEALNRILRSFKGEELGDVPETLTGEVLPDHAALSDLAELLNSSLPGESLALSDAFHDAIEASGFATGTVSSYEVDIVSGTSVVVDGVTKLVVEDEISLSVSGTVGYINALGPDIVSGTSSILEHARVISFEDNLTVGVTGSTAYVKGVSSSQDIGARVYNSANISIPNNSSTILTFDSEVYDTDGIHSTVSNTSRLTCQTAGKYIVVATAQFAIDGTGLRLFRLYKNGSLIADLSDIPLSTLQTKMNISIIVNLDVGDYMEVKAYQTSGGSLNIENAGSYSPYFMMQKIG